MFSIKGKSLYTRHDIYFKDGLDEKLINQIDFQLETEGSVIVPENLAGTLIERIKSNEFYTYRGKLVVVDDEISLKKSETDDDLYSYLIKKDAVLNISENFSVEDIKQTIGEIFLFGSVSLREGQRQAVCDKVAINEGDVEIIEDMSDNMTDNDNDSDKYAEYDIVINNAVEYSL